MTAPELKSLIDTAPTPFTFVTGGAGTGKSYLLREFRKLVGSKKCLTVAPTGSAANLIEARTIHSTFCLPTKIVCYDSLKDQGSANKIRANIENFGAILNAEYLIIDEISMVRRDIIAGIDDVLCDVCNCREPFGGKKLIMFGDLNQLPPVVTGQDASFLKVVYGQQYFFFHYPFTRFRINLIELTKIWRQSDERFSTMLNMIANNDYLFIPDIIKTLNETCYDDGYELGDEAIYLCANNETADKINLCSLNEIKESEYVFKAFYSSGYNRRDAPIPDTITLKQGCKVMIRVNDNLNRKYVNGTVGFVEGFNRGELSDAIESVEVFIPEINESVNINRSYFGSSGYMIDKETLEVSKRKDEWMCQFPLSLAYAITIHKSQGMGFDYMNLDATRYFSHGQLYTALSRAKTLEGLRLIQPLDPKMVIRDSTVDIIKRYSIKQEEREKMLAEMFSAKVN